MTDLLRVDNDDSGIVTVTMTMSHRRNSLSQEMIEALLSTFRNISHGEAAGVILAAEGPVFSSGHDFADMRGRSAASMRELLEVCSEMMLFIREMPQVVLARVQGPAVAAGFQLMESCDLAVSVDSATFWAPGGKAGWFCHTPMVAVAHNVSRKRAMEIGLTGDAIDAPTALSWGLINRSVAESELDITSRELLGRATRGTRASKSIGKRTLYRQMDLSIREAYDLATEVMALSSQTSSGQEAINSFAERRAPNYDDM